MTRRDFNTGMVLASTAAAVAQTPPRTDGVPHWYDRIRRLGQPNLNEKDAATVDVEKWVSYWKSLRADGLIVSAGGILAFYPTDVPHHQRSRYLGTRDVYGEFTRSMRQANMRVIARLDPNWAFQPALDAHPDWFARDQAGHAIPHTGANELFRTCMFGAYFEQHMVAIIRELGDRYDSDGFYTNGWPSTGLGDICYCDVCRTKYRTRFAAELPQKENRSDTNYRQWTTGVWTGYWRSGICGNRALRMDARIESTWAI